MHQLSFPYSDDYRKYLIDFNTFDTILVSLLFLNGAVNCVLYGYWMHWDRRTSPISGSAEALRAAEESMLYRGYFDLSNSQSDSIFEANRVVALAVADMIDARVDTLIRGT